MFFTSIGLSVHAMTLQWARTEVSPNECASFRYRSIHSLLIWLLREYFESDCMLRALFSKRCRFSPLSSRKIYWLYRWLHESSRPTGLANDSLQSLLSVDSLSYRQSVPTLLGNASSSDSVCTETCLSPTRRPSSPSSMSSSAVVFSIDRQKYFSTSPALSSVPVISSPTSRLRCTSPVSFTIRANCPTVSRKWAVVSLSISLGMMNPLHSEEKLLCILMRSFVVLVRYR